MNTPPALVWFRQDLRLADNTALTEAARAGPVIPVFIWSPDEEGGWPPGAASGWWLSRSLAALDESLRHRGLRLVLRPGPSADTLLNLARETGARAVYWNRRYEPAALRRDDDVERTLKNAGILTAHFADALLFEPSNISSSTGGPYRVFTPFWKACLKHAEPSEPLPVPQNLRGPDVWPVSESTTQFIKELHPSWNEYYEETWLPSEEQATKVFERFVTRSLQTYAVMRDRPDMDGVSRLSPYLHYGQISPRTVWHTARAHDEECAMPFLRQLGWREFAHHLLVHFPHTSDTPLRTEYTHYPWKTDMDALKAWKTGTTGYPVVDAAMRDLRRTGWMHNRLRMIVASFLVKDLLIPWQEGARWFWERLVDADLASNTLGWQWTAGCGADAAPFFRVFNPVTQARKFDPDGTYVRRALPELAQLPTKHLHAPWEAPDGVLLRAGVRLGETYPYPVVDHAAARRRALEGLERMKTKQKPGAPSHR